MIRYLALAMLLAGPAYAGPMCIGTADALAQLYEQKFKATNEGQLAPMPRSRSTPKKAANSW